MKKSMCLVHLMQQVKPPSELLIAREPVNKNEQQEEKPVICKLQGF